MNLLLKNVLGCKMYLLEDDPGISRELARKGCREMGAVKMVRRTLKPGMTVIDVGANLGYYVLLEAQLVGPEGKVYAIEPVEKNYYVLNKNIALNRRGNVETFQVAIGEKTKNQEMLLSRNSNHGTMMDMDKASQYYKTRMEKIGADKITVPTVTLDKFVKDNNIEKVDFIRMDVEGFELQVFKGMQKTLKDMSPTVLVEAHYVHYADPKVIDDMIRDMLDLGYEIADVATREKRVDVSLLKDIKRCPHILFTKKSSPNIHVLADMPTFNVGSGAHKAMFYLLDGLKERGFEVQVLQKPWTRGKMKSLYRWADIIFTQGSQVPRVKGLARGKPIAYYIHNDYRIATIAPLYKLNELDIDLFIFNANWVRERNPWRGDSIIVHPPVDIEKFKTTPGECITQVNLSEAKGGKTFTKIAKEMPEKEFLGVRGGWGLQIIPKTKNVRVIPKTPNIRDDVYAKTRILLMPSQYKGPTEPWNWTESWGMVGVEAMCSGIPVIAHPTPGLLESLSYAGIFVDRDNIAGWVEAIRKLDDPEVYKKHSGLALQRAQELDPTSQLDSLAKVIKERIWDWKYLNGR